MRLILSVSALYLLTACVSTTPSTPIRRRPTQENGPSVYSQFDGLSSVVVLASGTDVDLRLVAGFEQQPWIMGDKILLARLGEKFLPVEVPPCPQKDFKNLNVISAEEVHVGCTLTSGKDGQAIFDGKVWRAEESAAPIVKQKEWRSSNANIWTLEADGRIAHNDGQLVEHRPLSAKNLNAIAGVKFGGFENVWVAGDEGRLYLFDGVLWQHITTGTEEKLSSVWVDASGVAWIVGNKGLILKSTD